MKLISLKRRAQARFQAIAVALSPGQMLRRSIFSTAFILICLLVWFFITLFESKTGEVAGALGSFIGGLIGAGAAVGAVFLLIWRQTKDEAEKVAAAVKIEITTLVKYVIGAIEICQQIKSGRIQIPRQDAHYIVKNFADAPVIYPAVADRIGLLPHPQATTEFYMRLAEARVMVEMLQKKTTPQGITYTSANPEYITPEFARSVADSLLTALQLARPIIANEEESAQLRMWVDKVVTTQIDDCLTSAKASFPNSELFRDARSKE